MAQLRFVALEPRVRLSESQQQRYKDSFHYQHRT